MTRRAVLITGASKGIGRALELPQTGITVNAIAPDPVETELFRENSPPGSVGEQRYLAKFPCGASASPASSRRRSPFCYPRRRVLSLDKRYSWMAAHRLVGRHFELAGTRGITNQFAKLNSSELRRNLVQ